LMTTAGCSTLSHMQLCKLCWCRVLVDAHV